MKIKGALMIRNDLHIGAFFTSKGEEIHQPENILLVFKNISTDWKYLEHHYLDLIVDGERIDLGELEHDGKVGTYTISEYMKKKFH